MHSLTHNATAKGYVYFCLPSTRTHTSFSLPAPSSLSHGSRHLANLSVSPVSFLPSLLLETLLSLRFCLLSTQTHASFSLPTPSNLRSFLSQCFLVSFSLFFFLSVHTPLLETLWSLCLSLPSQQTHASFSLPTPSTLRSFLSQRF